MNKTVEFDIGNIVVCDYCDKDYTLSQDQGGILFCSKGICPECQPRAEANIAKYGEEAYIRDRARPSETFRDFIMRVRNGNNTVRITGPADWADETAEEWKGRLDVK